MMADILRYLQSISSFYPGGIPKALLSRKNGKKLCILVDEADLNSSKGLLVSIVEKGFGISQDEVIIVSNENEVELSIELLVIFGNFSIPDALVPHLKTYKLSEIKKDENKKRALWGQIKIWKAQGFPA